MIINTIENIFVILLLILVGVIAGKLKYIDENANASINKIILNISLPCMILSSFKQEYNSPGLYRDMFAMFVAYVILKSIWVLIGYLMFRKDKDKNYAPNRFSLIFSNSGYMGMPVAQAILGEKVLIFASIYSIFFNIFCNTLGISLFKGKVKYKEFLKLFTSPSIISAFIGILLFVLKVNLPFVLSKTISTLGSITTPLSFLTLGYTLRKSEFRGLFKFGKEYLICALRLIVIPITAYFFIKMFSNYDDLINSFTIIEAMPVASISVIFAANYKSEDLPYVSKIVFLSTILSLFTIPILTLIF